MSRTPIEREHVAFKLNPDGKPVVRQTSDRRDHVMNNTLLNYPKNIATAYALLFFLGIVGAHRFYTGRVGTGVLYLFTLGLLGIGVLVDVFTLAGKTDEHNRRAGRRR